MAYCVYLKISFSICVLKIKQTIHASYHHGVTWYITKQKGREFLNAAGVMDGTDLERKRMNKYGHIYLCNGYTS